MRVFRSLESVPPGAQGCAVSIGNFDGVHEGHRQLFQRNLEICAALGLVPSVLTFDPHPTHVVAPRRAPKLLTTIDERIALIGQQGIQQVFVLPFDRTFSQLSPEQFIRRVVVERIRAKAVLVGENFRFGAKQAGETTLLRKLGEQHGFHVEIVPSYIVRGRVASSTAVRELVTVGDVSKACRLLGRSYALDGQVVSGFGIGSRQTVPTLNLETAAEVLPARGVYITRTHDLDRTGRQWPSITNIGTRPTFDGGAQTIETFLLAKLDGDSPTHIRVDLLRRVRDERKFESPEALKGQILRDVGRAQTYFRRIGK